MNASKFILLAGLFAIITAKFSFAQNTPTPTTTVEPDPVKSFKELATRFPKRSIGKSGTIAYDFENATFDVKKTDSLMNPVVGIINFTANITGPIPLDAQEFGLVPTYTTSYECQMVFHWQGDHWKLARSKIITPMLALADQLNREIFRAEPMSEFLKSVQ